MSRKGRRLWPPRVVLLSALAVLLVAGLLSHPHLPLRIGHFGGQWFVEHCGWPSSREVFQCTDGIDWVTELDIDENADGVADLRTYFWDGSKPRECEERTDGRWHSLPVAECCCRAGCSAAANLAFGCPLPVR